ncbi:pyridoxamine 5'-phosphate oxidase family protein [Aspergillus tubingensis]|uniref:pyridoxamine 5'-phosphate oxidase family protein n=1 Tax=Aspergillus tubingensis TaxID=5068 RepID=UPI001579486C|nr:pyridoxamine phosphate oxidase [Aspergillus tubingensis]GFN17340.1 pyridoxamine phosphate oxidase [Aspergillus tubingensis]
MITENEVIFIKLFNPIGNGSSIAYNSPGFSVSKGLMKLAASITASSVAPSTDDVVTGAVSYVIRSEPRSDPGPSSPPAELARHCHCHSLCTVLPESSLTRQSPSALATLDTKHLLTQLVSEYIFSVSYTMADSMNPPLSYEASATTTHPHVGTTLPTEVISCLKNSRFLHLATCDGLTPHISLMSYTYLPSTPYDPYPTIIMTTNPSSRKTNHLLTNPRVSLLVHDWVSHRPPTRAPNPDGREGSPPPAATRSSLASLLLNLNTSALSSISTTIAGTARFLEPGSEEEAWCKKQHLENNTFEEELGTFGQQLQQQPGQRRPSISIDSDVRVVTVQVREGRIADWKGGVRDWQLVSEGEGTQGTMVNGIAPA